MPGFIDTHIHYPQTRVIASYGAQLLEWLQKYTFVEEQKFSDRGHADEVARFFLDEMFRQGTTTAVVYCTVRPESVDAFFTESERRGARMIAGKVMMDRNAPAALTDAPQQGYDESKALLAGSWQAAAERPRLCDHAAAFGDHLDRSAARGGGRAGCAKFPRRSCRRI